MFDVIISDVRNGKVQRETFATRDEAEAFLVRWETKVLTPRLLSNGRLSLTPSLRNFRTEIVYRENPVLLPLIPAATPASSTSAA